MIIFSSLISISLLLGFFTLLGLGITGVKYARNNFALIPVFGYAVLLGLSYVISANLKISGADSTGMAILLLAGCCLARIRSVISILKNSWQSGELKTFLAVVMIPVCTLLLPALWMGFKYFYAYVNYDFFYNSQDSNYLLTHNVIQFDIRNGSIVPLNWSANYSGRIAVGLLGAFFSQWINMSALQFNSLLLNTIVILFALSTSVFCREFFGFSKRNMLIAVFLCIMSAGYVQGYCYYVLGQISTVPIFVLYCICLKSFLDQARAESNFREMAGSIGILCLLLNILFVMYAILSFFALCITVMSYLISFRDRISVRSLLPIAVIFSVTVFLFALSRILIAPETILVFKSWIQLSDRVAGGNKSLHTLFIVCSEYLTEAVLALLFGLANYPTTKSIFGMLLKSDALRIASLIIVGLAALTATIMVIKKYASSSDNTRAARAIILSLFALIFSLTLYFFFTMSGYGIYKLQTWFMPSLLPIYLYILLQPRNERANIYIRYSCIAIILLNLFTGFNYLNDFMLSNAKKGFVNSRGVTGNRDIIDVTAMLKNYQVQPVSLFLINGLETAWVSDLIRTIKIDKAAHNAQPLNDAEFDENTCDKFTDQNWAPTGLLVTPNQYTGLTDITPGPIGEKILYKNKSFNIIDPSALETLVYLGRGSYPVEFYRNHDNSFPAKFRWVEKGIIVYIYSRHNKKADFSIDVTPGNVDTAETSRHFIVSVNSEQHQFAVDKKSTLAITGIKLHQGLNCLVVKSPDNVIRRARNGAIVRKNIPLDPRVNNFAISGIKLTTGSTITNYQ